MKPTDTAIRARGLLAEFNAARVLGLADVHVALRLGELSGESDERLHLAAALTVRALREGSVCLRLSEANDFAPVGDEDDESVEQPPLPWPDPAGWRAAVEASPMVTRGAQAAGLRPLRLVGDLLYLEKYWQEERQVEHALTRRRDLAPPAHDPAVLASSLEAIATPATDLRGHDDWQREAVRAAITHTTSVVAGGPGTGKTHTVAKILLALADQYDGVLPRVALAAPTGKAAQRLEQSVRAALQRLGSSLEPPEGVTLHRLLGASFSTFRYDEANQLPLDFLVVDEASMVSLTMMSRLLAALHPTTRMVLIGDPDQLASVDAGAVFADVMAARPLLHHPLSTSSPVVTLRQTWRYGGAISDAAQAVRDGDSEALIGLLTTADADAPARLVQVDAAAVDLDDPALALLSERLVITARATHAHALAGRAAEAVATIDEHRLLCAHRRGPYGIGRWNWLVRRHLAASIPGYGAEADPYVGEPLLITQNQKQLTPTSDGLWNGDSAVIIRRGDHLQAAVGRAGEPMVLSAFMLGETQQMHAMTIHKSQGSQFDAVSIILPDVESRLLTRQLLYTALTRAKRQVTIYGSIDAVRAALARSARRASGLASIAASGDQPGPPF